MHAKSGSFAFFVSQQFGYVCRRSSKKDVEVMKRIWYLGLVCLLMFGFAPAASARSDMALVRVLHAAQDVPPADVYVNGNIVLTDVRYLQVSGYLELPAGLQKVALAPAGSSLADAVFTTDLDVAANKTYSVIAVNDNGVKAQVVNDDLAALPGGKARLRFIHGSPDAPGVNVALDDGTPLFNDVSYGQASDYKLVDAGTYDLRITAAESNAAVISLPNTELKAGVVYDVVAAGDVAQLKAQILTARPAAEGDTIAAQDTAAPPRLPVTGASDSYNWLLLLCAVVLFGGGVLMRLSSLQFGNQARQAVVSNDSSPAEESLSDMIAASKQRAARFAQLLKRNDILVKEITLRVRASIRDISG